MRHGSIQLIRRGTVPRLPRDLLGAAGDQDEIGRPDRAEDGGTITALRPARRQYYGKRHLGANTNHRHAGFSK
jgi:hypothetical protein